MRTTNRYGELAPKVGARWLAVELWCALCGLFGLAVGLTGWVAVAAAMSVGSWGIPVFVAVCGLWFGELYLFNEAWNFPLSIWREA